MIGPIQTERLQVKLYQEKDREKLKMLLADSEIKQTFMLPDCPTEQALNALTARVFQYAFDETRLERGIFLKDELIGFVNDVGCTDATIELGYVIHPRYQNNGYATEVLSAVIRALFEKGYDEVRTGAFRENVASIRVMQKCGMTKTEEEETIEYRGVQQNCVYYHILQR